MAEYSIVRLRERSDLGEMAARWFHQKWGFPYETYLESIDAYIKNKSTIPQWYVVISDGRIIGGCGVIDNDFHDRKDLTPNVCGVFVEEDFRNLGIAGAMLNFVCNDMKDKGISTLYLVTDHTSFYERYGWRFLCMVTDEIEHVETRLYIHKAE